MTSASSAKRPRAGPPGAGHGGRLERFALMQDHDAPQRHSSTSSLAEHLLRQWAWGQISSNTLQQISMHAYDDQVNLLESMNLSADRACPKLQAMARLGNWGQQPGNVQVQLLSWLGAPSTPPCMMHKVPVLVTKSRAGVAASSGADGQEIDFPVLLPHVLFAWLYDNHRDRFNKLFLGACPRKADVGAFWKEMSKRKDPRLEGHPMRARPDWNTHAIPLSLHGDGVPVLQVGKSGAKSFEVYSLQSLFVTGSTLTVKLMLFGLWSSIATDASWREVWRIVTWSLRWLYMGVWPPVDWNGEPWSDTHPSERSLANQPLAGDYFGVIYAFKGDLDYFTKNLKLRNFNSLDMCDLCPATRRDSDRSLMYNNFDRDAAWKRQLYDRQTWRALYDGRLMHWIFNLAGLDNLALEPDELHVLHLGVSQYAQGSVLHTLVFDVLGGPPNGAMKALWERICEYDSSESPDCQYTSLSIKSFVNPDKAHDDFPSLKGKGAEVRDLLPGTCTLWRELASDHPQYRRVDKTMTALCDAQGILRRHAKDLFLPVEAAEQLHRRVETFLQGYQELAHDAETAGQLRWSLPSKFHWFWHLGQKAKYINPRRTNCFVDEDFVGKIKGLVHSCAAGTELHAMIGKAMEKYRWELHVMALDGAPINRAA